MACLCGSQRDSSASCSVRVDDDDDEIEFVNRSSRLATIYQDDERKEHRIILEDWTARFESAERRLARKQANASSGRSDLYQILGLFFVFQGVVLTAVAQASQLKCHNWILPFLLCLLASVAAFWACLQKVQEIAESTEQHRLEKAYTVSLQKSIESLKQEGTAFNLKENPPVLVGPYTKPESQGSGRLGNCCSCFSQWCSVWILSSAGAVLILLACFSGVVLFSVHQILCNSGE